MKKQTALLSWLVALLICGVAPIDLRAQSESTEEEEEEYYADYDARETVEDSLKRAKANAFDTLSSTSFLSPDFRMADTAYIQGLKKNPEFGYVETGIPHREESEPLHIDIRFWMYTALIILIILISWYLLTNGSSPFHRKRAGAPQLDDENSSRNIFTVDYAEDIANAVNAKNFRLAVRLHYLELLTKLSEQNIIQYQPDKTNFDYLLQVKPTSYYADFFKLTQHYEYCWYGLFPVDEAQYQLIRDAFLQFTQNLRPS